MSDSKRAKLITVGASKCEKSKVCKTVRLSINLEESNESKYPELNYKELVIAEERKKPTENGRTDGLNPFSDNDEDVERVARKFEQKYGGNSTYGKKTKQDLFADIGAGYDENDSFIDNTDGYDEMLPPECDTLLGGFYINSGALVFKNVQEQQNAMSDDGGPTRSNKRRISSSSSDDDSSDSSSDSSQGSKAPKTVANGALGSHSSQHRKKKSKKDVSATAKKVRRTDSSAATSGKQTSDDNAGGDAESVDSSTQSDSLTSKPGPSSENVVTSDSSRDWAETKLPSPVQELLDEIEALAGRSNDVDRTQVVLRLEKALSQMKADSFVERAAWGRTARAFRSTKSMLLKRARAASTSSEGDTPSQPTTTSTANHTTTTAINNVTANTTSVAATAQPTKTNHKKKRDEEPYEDFNLLNEDQREEKIVETLQRLKLLIDERKPAMIANYNAECERVQEERKKIQIASAAEGAPHVEKRLPKRRFPWCPRSRALLSRLKRLALDQEAAALLMAKRVLPLFPNGFVRMPTLLRQADLSKELKPPDLKRQTQPIPKPPPSQPVLPLSFSDNIQFPSTLTVTTSVKPTDKIDIPTVRNDKDNAFKDIPFKDTASIFSSIINPFSLGKDLILEQQEKRKESVIVEKAKDEYVPNNNIGSITITAVPNQKDKKVTAEPKKQTEPLIRVKSPAALNEMVKKEKDKALENIHKRDKHKKDKNKDRLTQPLHVDTNLDAKKDPTPSPKAKDKISPKQLDNLRASEDKIPRPGLVPVYHSPTFIKPDKRPPEKKKKDIIIVSDLDPLGDINQEPVPIDDSSSDVELVEEKCEKDKQSESVPSKDKVVSVNERRDQRKDSIDIPTKEEFDSLMKNIRDLEHSQDTAKFNSNAYSGVITSANHEHGSRRGARAPVLQEERSDADKLTNFFEQNGWM